VTEHGGSRIRPQDPELVYPIWSNVWPIAVGLMVALLAAWIVYRLQRSEEREGVVVALLQSYRFTRIGLVAVATRPGQTIGGTTP